MFRGYDSKSVLGREDFLIVRVQPGVLSERPAGVVRHGYWSNGWTPAVEVRLSSSCAPDTGLAQEAVGLAHLLRSDDWRQDLH
jgi:hypothetical protein